MNVRREKGGKRRKKEKKTGKKKERKETKRKKGSAPFELGGAIYSTEKFWGNLRAACKVRRREIASEFRQRISYYPDPCPIVRVRARARARVLYTNRESVPV